jgi:hypothetical protein
MTDKKFAEILVIIWVWVFTLPVAYPGIFFGGGGGVKKIRFGKGEPG